MKFPFFKSTGKTPEEVRVDPKPNIYGLQNRDTKGAKHYWVVLQDASGRHLMFEAQPGQKDYDKLVEDPMRVVIDFFLDIATAKGEVDAKDYLDKYHVQIVTDEELK